MKELSFLILAIVVTIFFISGYVVQDIVHAMPQDETRDNAADFYFFVCDGVWKLCIPIVALYASRGANWRMVAAFFSFLVWIMTGNLWDEFAAEGNCSAEISKVEYAMAAIALITCFLEYHKFYPIKSLVKSLWHRLHKRQRK